MRSFYTWMKQFKHDDNPIGDLARDMCCDKDFPRHSVCHKHIKDYLEARNACWGALDAFEEAFEKYKLFKKLIINKE